MMMPIAARKSVVEPLSITIFRTPGVPTARDYRIELLALLWRARALMSASPAAHCV
jgi:hypothetical protein